MLLLYQTPITRRSLCLKFKALSMHASCLFFCLVHVPPRPCNCDTTSIIVNSSSSRRVFCILYSIVLMIEVCLPVPGP